MLRFLTLLALLFLLDPLHAITSCIDPTQLQPPESPSPSHSDCLHIFTHLPFPLTFTPNLYLHLHSDFTLHPPSSPFFPTATFAFGSCYAQISYHINVLSPQLYPYLEYQAIRKHLRAQRRTATPEHALSEASVRKIWAKAKMGLGRIVDECVDKGETGLDWGSVYVEEAKWAWYAVEVSGKGQVGVVRRNRFKNGLFEFGEDREL